MRRTEHAIALLLLLPLLAGCAARPAAVSAAGRMTPHRSATASPSLSAEASTATPAAQIDPGPLLGKPLKHGKSGTRKIAITMDDGTAKNSGKVMDIFERYGVRCTFFYVGKRMGHPKIVERAYAEGFEIGDHTWDHQEIKGRSLAFDLSEIDRGARRIAAITGRKPIFVRPPAGHWDKTTLRAITKRRMVMALWNLHGHDTGAGTKAATIARDVVRSARGGDIILLHETNPETVKALPSIIRGLQRKGFKLVTLSGLLAP
jgi:peptidoglycan-N-acetylglucosamine deacetylase